MDKASAYEAGDCGFESRRRLLFCQTPTLPSNRAFLPSIDWSGRSTPLPLVLTALESTSDTGISCPMMSTRSTTSTCAGNQISAGQSFATSSSRAIKSVRLLPSSAQVCRHFNLLCRHPQIVVSLPLCTITTYSGSCIHTTHQCDLSLRQPRARVDSLPRPRRLRRYLAPSMTKSAFEGLRQSTVDSVSGLACGV
jgi:hypothetical protein